MAAWPGSLPQTPLAAGFQQPLQNNLVRTDMDAGKAKVRRRFTAGVMPVSAALLLTSAQKETLRTFFNTTLSHGADEFDWTDHVSGASAKYRFVEPPAFSPAGAGLWDVRLELEIVP